MTPTPETGTARIRWNTGAEKWATAWFGSVGTIDPHLFSIFRPMAPDDEWALTSSLPGHAGKASCGAGPDPEKKLKAEAERWLEEFASSLGAIFGDAVAADLRSRAEELAAVVDRRPGAEHGKLLFAAGLKRAADLIEHGDEPAVNDEPAKEAGQ